MITIARLGGIIMLDIQAIEMQMNQIKQKIAKPTLNMIDVQMMKMSIQQLSPIAENNTDVQNIISQANDKIHAYMHRT